MKSTMGIDTPKYPIDRNFRSETDLREMATHNVCEYDDRAKE